MRWFALLVALVLAFSSPAISQPFSDQEWFLNTSLSSDTLTIACSEFVLPIDVGRFLAEPDPINVRSGEMSQTLSSPHSVKTTLQPESGTSDTLSTISGCTIDGATLILSTQDVGDTITITDSGNIDTPGGNVVLDAPDIVVELVRRGSVYVFKGSVGGGGGGGSQDMDETFDLGRIIDGADENNPVIIAGEAPYNVGTSTAWEIYVDTITNQPVFRGRCAGGDCPHDEDVGPGQCKTLSFNGVEAQQTCDDGPTTFSGVHRPTGYIGWQSSGMFGDNSNCNLDPTAETLGADPGQGLRCPMTGSETDGTVKSEAVRLPDNFDKTAGITAEMMAWVHTDEGACTWHGHIAIACSSDGESRTYATEIVGLDLTPEGTGKVIDSSQATITTDGTGTGEDCNPGDYISWRWTSCDTDATPSGGCTSSAGCEDNMSLQSLTLFYSKNER